MRASPPPTASMRDLPNCNSRRGEQSLKGEGGLARQGETGWRRGARLARHRPPPLNAGVGRPLPRRDCYAGGGKELPLGQLELDAAVAPVGLLVGRGVERLELAEAGGDQALRRNALAH